MDYEWEETLATENTKIAKKPEENANIEHPTPNFQRRTEENQRVKENVFCLLLSAIMFDVRR